MKILIFCGLLLGATLTSPIIVRAQADLDRLDEKFRHHIEPAMSEWKYKRGKPTSEGENVLVQFWSFSERRVMISVMPYRSAQDAKQALQEFAKYLPNKETVPGYGDEAYAWGYGLSKIAFRRGRFNIYVSTTAEIGARPEERTLTDDQRFDLMKSEMRKWSRVFAGHAAKAIDDQ